MARAGAPRNPRPRHGARSSTMGALQKSTAAPWLTVQPHRRAPGIHGAPWRATQPHGRAPRNPRPPGRAVLFPIGTGASEMGGAVSISTGALQVGGADAVRASGAVSNRHRCFRHARCCFRSAPVLSRWAVPMRPGRAVLFPPEPSGSVPEQAAPRRRLPQRPALPALASETCGAILRRTASQRGACGGPWRLSPRSQAPKPRGPASDARRAYPCRIHVQALSMHTPHPRTIPS